MTNQPYPIEGTTSRPDWIPECPYFRTSYLSVAQAWRRSATIPQQNPVLCAIRRALREGEQTGRLFSVRMHPFVSGQPIRPMAHKAVRGLLGHKLAHDAGEISSGTYQNFYDAALASVSVSQDLASAALEAIADEAAVRAVDQF